MDLQIAENSRQSRNRYADISGLDEFSRPKAHVVITYTNRYSDGSTELVQELMIPVKPIVTVFKHAGFVNVLLDFLSREDMDLAMAWDILSSYSQPQNSVDWTFDELESGYYIDEDGEEKMIYYPLVELILSPIGRESEYQFHGFNPVFYTLQPNGPKGIPCVLQITFPEDWFILSENLDEVDLHSIRNEVMAEMGYDMGGGIDPDDLSAIEE